MRIIITIYHLIKFQLTPIQTKSVPQVQIKKYFKVKKYYLTTKRELKNNFYCPKQVNLVDHLKIKYKNANRQ